MKAISSGAANTAQLHLPAPDPGSRQPPAPRGRPAPRGTARPRHAPKAVPPPTGASTFTQHPQPWCAGAAAPTAPTPCPQGRQGETPPRHRGFAPHRALRGAGGPCWNAACPVLPGAQVRAPRPSPPSSVPFSTASVVLTCTDAASTSATARRGACLPLALRFAAGRAP